MEDAATIESHGWVDNRRSHHRAVMRSGPVVQVGKGRIIMAAMAGEAINAS